MSLFNELPLATIVGAERSRHRLVGHLMTAIEVARALSEIHRLEIFHVDLNPMNILHRTAERPARHPPRRLRVVVRKRPARR